MIDALRHISVFSPDNFGTKKVSVIGAGATGSKIVMQLAKLGVKNIDVWDDDLIEHHNIPNQEYGNHQVGQLKVQALYELVKQTTGTEINIYPEKFLGNNNQELGEIVFLLVDTMEARKNIWDKSIKMKLNVKLMIETRMGADNGRVYAVEPSNIKNIRGWEDTLYDDDETEESACGATVSVGPTAGIIAGMAVWQMIHWFNLQSGTDSQQLENEILVAVNPFFVSSCKFNN